MSTLFLIVCIITMVGDFLSILLLCYFGITLEGQIKMFDTLVSDNKKILEELIKIEDHLSDIWAETAYDSDLETIVVGLADQDIAAIAKKIHEEFKKEY